MVWERIGKRYVNLPEGMWDDDPVEAAPIKREPRRADTVHKTNYSADELAFIEKRSNENMARRGITPEEADNPEVYRTVPKKMGRKGGRRGYTFESIIEKYRFELMDIYYGGELMARLTQGRILTLRKYQVLLEPGEVIEGWDHKLTPAAVHHLKLERG